MVSRRNILKVINPHCQSNRKPKLLPFSVSVQHIVESCYNVKMENLVLETLLFLRSVCICVHCCSDTNTTLLVMKQFYIYADEGVIREQ